MRCRTRRLSHTDVMGAHGEPHLGGEARMEGPSRTAAAAVGFNRDMSLYWWVSVTNRRVRGMMMPAENTRRAKKGACHPYAWTRNPPARTRQGQTHPRSGP